MKKPATGEGDGLDFPLPSSTVCEQMVPSGWLRFSRGGVLLRQKSVIFSAATSPVYSTFRPEVSGVLRLTDAILLFK